MSQNVKNPLIQESNDLKTAYDIIRKNYKVFSACIIAAMLYAFFLVKYSVPVYKISSAILIKEDENFSSSGNNVNNYLNSTLFGVNQNFQNEIWVLKSKPVIEQTVLNLNLMIEYYQKKGFKFHDAYQELPFQVLLLIDHAQPVERRFSISVLDSINYVIKVKPDDTKFEYLLTGAAVSVKEDWSFEYSGKFGQLIETPDLAFMINWRPENLENNRNFVYKDADFYSFVIKDFPSVVNDLKDAVQTDVIDNNATIIEITYKTSSVKKGVILWTNS